MVSGLSSDAEKDGKDHALGTSTASTARRLRQLNSGGVCSQSKSQSLSVIGDDHGPPLIDGGLDWGPGSQGLTLGQVCVRCHISSFGRSDGLRHPADHVSFHPTHVIIWKRRVERLASVTDCYYALLFWRTKYDIPPCLSASYRNIFVGELGLDIADLSTDLITREVPIGDKFVGVHVLKNGECL